VRTLAAATTIEIEIKRSRFVAHAAPVENLKDTLKFFERVADPAATHNCWAWRLGQEYRFNDDGEPASSAGKPIYAAIEGKGLDQAMVVVTRYFGGTKLGIGGLVRAYGGSASRCIDRAGIIEVRPVAECVIDAGFAWTGAVYATLESFDARKLGETFGADGVCVRAEILLEDLERLKTVLRDTTRGEAKVRVSDDT
jgi:uncharacterized YigZ family protein